MRLTTACALLLLACTACAAGKNPPTVQNNVVTYRNFRAITVSDAYTLYKAEDADTTITSVETSTMTTRQDVTGLVFVPRKKERIPEFFCIVYHMLPDNWQFVLPTGELHVRLGGEEVRGFQKTVDVNNAPYRLLSVYYSPFENRVQSIDFYFPEERIPDVAKDEAASRDYVIARLQEVIVAF